MRSKKNLWIIAMLLVMAFVAAACGGDSVTDEPDATSSGDVAKGGIARYEYEEFGYTGGFDPTGEYLGDAWGLYTNLLLRTLVSYPHVAGAAGNEIVPDLAADLPEISEDGLTYTFTLKDGVKFGPPLSREITSADIEYAFRRIATESVVAQYGYYYEGTIEGLEIGKDPGAGGISGIKTPDEKTIEFTLTKPTGDFLNRVAMPATAPIPEEVAKCFTKAGEYGRYVISSAGYMLEGADALDVSSCDSMKPISGFDPTKAMVMVRNPDYDQSTDEYRENNIDGFEFNLNTNTNDLEQKVIAGDIDFVYNPTPPTLRKFVQDPELKERLYLNAGDRIWYITMNLAEPPFDDIHVRKAANLVMDKEGLRRAWGGETAGDIATHIIPDTMMSGSLDDYDPYPSEGFAGDEEAAKEEMKQSKYDSDGDGVCDDPVCDGVLQIGSNTPPNTEMLPIVESSLEKIGITLDSREVTDAYTPILTVAKEVPISIRPGWGKDFPDVFTFVGVLFNGEGILCTGNYNYSLVGLTEEKAKECGIDMPAEPIPSVDEDTAACVVLTGEERLACWAELDKTLMEEVVPWIPYLDSKAVWVTGPAVTKYEFDQFTTTTAWSNIAIDESQQ